MIATSRWLMLGLTVLALAACAAGPTSDQGAAPATRTGAHFTPGRGCPSPLTQNPRVGIAIDYVDTFRLLGRDYMASLDPVPAAWDPAHPGQPSGLIQCTISAYTVSPSYQLQDGDATFLPVGTPVYLVPATAGSTIAVVSVNGAWRTYTVLKHP